MLRCCFYILVGVGDSIRLGFCWGFLFANVLGLLLALPSALGLLNLWVNSSLTAVVVLDLWVCGWRSSQPSVVSPLSVARFGFRCDCGCLGFWPWDVCGILTGGLLVAILCYGTSSNMLGCLYVVWP